jgi:hypothetical protein
MKTLSPEDYYSDKGKIVFTAAYHLKRGYCCGNSCTHCPYLKPPVKGTTTLENNPMKKALYLDDVRTPTTTINGYEPWYVVRNYDEFVTWITANGIPDLISFDHDLAEEHINDYFNQVALVGYQHPDYEKYTEKTGLDCARWLGGYIQHNNAVLKAVCVHSHNPVGATNIQSYINGLKRHMGWEQDCYLGRHPFTTEKEST